MPNIFACLIAVIFCLVQFEPASLTLHWGGAAQAATTTAKKNPPKKAAVKKASAKKAKVVKPNRKKQVRQKTRQVQPSAPADYAELVVDANTGTILFEKNADQIRHPASLTKMMTLYLLFEAINKGQVSMSTQLPVSEKAAGQPPTNIFLNDGDRVPVRTAIEALIIRSANDVAMVVAEALGGSQADFAVMMNRKARELGMSKTRFYNPSGLPDDRQVTTAMDMARLGIALRRDFPEYYHYFSQDDFSFAGRDYTTHNRLLGRYPGADGIKTGYIRASGFNLVTSVERGRTRLVGVVLGGRTGAARDQEMMDILDATFLALASNPKGRKMVVKPTNNTPAAMGDDRASEPVDSQAEPTAVAPAPTKPASIALVAPKQVENWGVQVGAYADEVQAQAALNEASTIAGASLAHATVEISTVARDSQTFYRARMLGLSANEARDACTKLAEQNHTCMVVRVAN